MSVGAKIRDLGTFLEECDDGTGTVHTVEVSGRADVDASLAADVELTIRTAPSGDDPGLVAEDVDIGDDGRLSLVLETERTIVPMDDHELEVEPTDARISEDGTVTVSIRASEASADERTDGERSLEPDDSPTSVPVESDEESSERRGDDLPPFRNPDLLADVYDSCETFAEMTEAIEMDVTAETVRRYMIDYGIHEPTRYTTGDEKRTADDVEDESTATDEPEDAAGESGTDSPPTTADEGANQDSDLPPPVVLTDGLGLPDELTVDALVETVSRSNTVYEVAQDVGLERQETTELLRRLNLIDFVVGRIAREHERNVDREEILEHLRNASVTRQQA